eukprot:3012436-Pleurochrysis_carterae.AAC.2
MRACLRDFGSDEGAAVNALQGYAPRPRRKCFRVARGPVSASSRASTLGLRGRRLRATLRSAGDRSAATVEGVWRHASCWPSEALIGGAMQ